MLIKTERPVGAVDNPTWTAARRLGRFRAGLDESRYYDQKNHPKTLTLPGIDMARLRRAWGPHTAGMPRLEQATFRVPLGTGQTEYMWIRDRSAALWLKEMDMRGYDLKPWPGAATPLRVYPGVYPAIDLDGGYPILDMREFIIEGYFSLRKPQPLVLEIPREVIDPLVVNA